MENDLVSDPRRFWSYFKNKNINSPDNLFYNNMRYNNDGDTANAFADYLSSAFKPSTDFDGNDECKSDCVGDLVKIKNVTYDDVVLTISELKSSPTVGVDNIPSFIIKGCSEFLIYPLLVLFNLSLRTKVFLGVWKQTKIIPVFKKGDAQNCKNYRPIAILSPFSKIFESIIHEKLYNQVKNLISTSQHGFIPKRSTTTNLFCLTDKIINSFESGSQLDVIYTDFSKAFDSMDFGVLLKKLQAFKGCWQKKSQYGRVTPCLRICIKTLRYGVTRPYLIEQPSIRRHVDRTLSNNHRYVDFTLSNNHRIFSVYKNIDKLWNLV
ncbi:hypothetical protein AVEN_6999-1 [Araneus ventricosus]|uniref:Reverse transcriptase domain-containing protein n=1 Tax=Araneus ventricosus TaxID=182803 RepID=A0A4Y2JN44_ARAVE|nr:hypothetical protein AVEN_6999-1 [Araneus ventricosus]